MENAPFAYSPFDLVIVMLLQLGRNAHYAAAVVIGCARCEALPYTSLQDLLQVIYVART